MKKLRWKCYDCLTSAINTTSSITLFGGPYEYRSGCKARYKTNTNPFTSPWEHPYFDRKNGNKCTTKMKIMQHMNLLLLEYLSVINNFYKDVFLKKNRKAQNDLS